MRLDIYAIITINRSPRVAQTLRHTCPVLKANQILRLALPDSDQPHRVYLSWSQVIQNYHRPLCHSTADVIGGGSGPVPHLIAHITHLAAIIPHPSASSHIALRCHRHMICRVRCLGYLIPRVNAMLRVQRCQGVHCVPGYIREWCNSPCQRQLTILSVTSRISLYSRPGLDSTSCTRAMATQAIKQIAMLCVPGNIVAC